MLKRHKDSHLDHGLTEAQILFVLEAFKDQENFFKATIEIPKELGTVRCDLYGPLVGDEPLGEADTFYKERGGRKYTSRLVDKPPRRTNLVTVIGGPHDGEPCVLYTAFGGPLTPRETNELLSLGHRDRDDDGELRDSREFWSRHALSSEEFTTG